jgi:hypothetical protein
MFVQLLRSDEEGQFLPTLSIEIKHFSIHGFESAGGVYFDIVHMDGEHERLLLSGDLAPFSPMEVGKQKLVQSVTIVPWPTSGEVLTKVQWREQVGPFKVFSKQHA